MPRSQSGTSLVVLPGNSQLSAEVRLGQTISEFAQCLDIAGKQAFQKLQVQLAQTGPLSPADVITLTEQLNREGAKRHAAWRPAAGTRIGGFLRRIQQFAAFGDILIGGSQNLIASGVWATVRVMLEATICHHVYFDQISSLLMRLTTSWTIAQEFVQHFPGSKELQTYLAEYLIRIVRLCKQILVFSQRSPAMLLASSLFSSFDAEFLPLQQELDQWGLLIEKQFASLTTKTIIEGQAMVAKTNRHLSRFVAAKSKRQLLQENQQRLLNSLSPNQDSFDLIFRRERKRGNCAWLLSDPDYTSWKSATSSLLHLTGHLGSGKTVGMANIAADLTGRKGGCALFFCKRDNPRTQSRNSIIGSLLHQLIYNNLTACHWNSLEDGCLLPVGTVTVDSVLRMLPSLLPVDQEYFLLIDGLEECPEAELDDTIQTLLELQLTFQISLCLSKRSFSHTLPLIGSSFTAVYSVSLNSLSKESELHQYIWSEVRVRNSLRQPAFLPDMESQIAEQLITGAQGMYLWVSLQLEAIFPSRQNNITTDETVIDILGNLPNSLPEAFDQALARVSDKRYGMKIFGLVATAAEPLTADQLKVALTVEPGNTSWEFGKLPHDSRHLVSCCGGTLLEMDEEDGKVRYIHHSVVSYLATFKPSQESPLCLSWLEDAEQTMGLICTTYLSYGVFDTRIATTKNVDAKRIIDSAEAAAKTSRPLFAHLIRHIRNGKQIKSVPKGLNILNVLHQVQFSKEDDILKCLLPYAKAHWLQHTRFVNAQENSREYLLWLTIFEEKTYLVNLPWEPERRHWSALVDYALDHCHNCLFQYTIRKVLKFSDLVPFRQLLASEGLKRCNIRGPWLDNVVALCVAPGPPINPSLLDRLITLGASPEFPLGSFPDDETGSPGIWRIATSLCQEDRVHRMKIGLPLLRTVLRSATDRILLPKDVLSLRLDRDLISRWLLQAVHTEWYDALLLFVDPSNMDLFNRMGFSLEKDELGLLTTIEANPTQVRLDIARLFLEHGARVEQRHRKICRAKAWNQISRLQPCFVRKALENSTINSIASSKLGLVDGSRLKRIYDVLCSRAATSHAIMDILEEEELSSPDLSDILSWIMDFESFDTLKLLLESPTWDKRVSSDIGWHTLLHREVFAILSNQTLDCCGHPLSQDSATHELILWMLISRVRLHGDLNIGVDHGSMGYTALHYAATCDRSWKFSPVDLLLRAGANPNTLSLRGHTPLEVAMSSNLRINDVIATVTELLNAGADPNIKCGNGLTLLHLAASIACQEIVHLLVQAGADITQASMVLISADLERALELTALVSCIEGWAASELQDWGIRAQKAVTIWDYYYIWRRKHLYETRTQSR
ncbi:hypothetical protein V8F33_009439 [Rhypophila sp. PSN 637]